MPREEFLLEQILAELRKKPSAWQVKDVGVGELFKVLPEQVWEVYVHVVTGSVINLNGIAVNTSAMNARWLPVQVGATFSELSGEIGTAGMGDTVLSAMTVYLFCMSISGWVLSGG